MHALLERYDTKETQAYDSVVFAVGDSQEDCEPLAREMLQKILKPGIVHPWFGYKFSPPKLGLRSSYKEGADTADILQFCAQYSDPIKIGLQMKR